MKLVSLEPVPLSDDRAQYTFMLGWSKSMRLDQIKLDLSKDDSVNSIDFYLESH